MIKNKNRYKTIENKTKMVPQNSNKNKTCLCLKAFNKRRKKFWCKGAENLDVSACNSSNIMARLMGSTHSGVSQAKIIY